MPKLTLKVPTYRRHKPRNEAFMELSGERIYLGRWNSAESRTLYDQLLANWLRSGRSSVLPQPPSATADLVELPPQAPVYTIQNLVDDFAAHAAGYYRKAGRETSEADLVRRALAMLGELFGEMAAEDFGPKQLATLQQHMLRRDCSRTYINRQLLRIRRGFRWAVTTEHMQPTPKYRAMLEVRGLAKGRTTAREPVPVEPVADETVNATLEHLPLVVADMVRFQRLTGCRPGEVCDLTPGAIERRSDIWVYRVKGHKTDHFSHDRSVVIGPRAQTVLAPYLDRAANRPCFSPRESERRRRLRQHEVRTTPPLCGNRPGTNRRRKPNRKPGRKYTVASYRRAIRRAVDTANRVRATHQQPALNPWSPNQLRHSAATQIRRQFGLEASQVVLGHSHASVTQVYAQRDEALAMEVARTIG